MGFQIRTEINIQASPSTVWNVLTDFDHYKDWNPFITSFEGKPTVGKSVKVRIEPPKGSPMNFQPTILVLEKDKELRWLGKLGFKGVFDGEHIFQLKDQGNGNTLLIQCENFKGILVPLFKGQLNTKTRKGFEEMNQVIKERAEGSRN